MDIYSIIYTKNGALFPFYKTLSYICVGRCLQKPVHYAGRLLASDGLTIGLYGYGKDGAIHQKH